ncbi:hypothetical protein PITCH_A760071 [uncultured Desulfobacterium sp.]|uniref:Uncharacterized protein n=1 Tax=uncultured Desulfobacterium sp. TaxID=201089 RepID=A0A445N2E8_9BACT|nr:hypothetical protein PITCH_A760071 [uncultured Desulfobacterium sp.]
MNKAGYTGPQGGDMKRHEHDRQHPRPSARAFLTNLEVTMPLRKKIWLIFRNNMKKIITLSDCCGHPGEPGC